MGQAAKTKGTKGRGARVARRLRISLLVFVPCWLLLSWFVARPKLAEWLGQHFEGEARVRFALIWPNLDVSAFGLEIRGKHHRLSATSAHVTVRLLGLFGPRPIRSVTVGSLVGEFAEDATVKIFRGPGGATGTDAAPTLDSEPAYCPPLRFDDPSVVLVRASGARQALFSCGRIDLRQAGENLFRATCDGGMLLRSPFEKITARLMPRAGRLLVDDLKMRSYNGMVRGYVDIDATEAGSFNGELEWRFAEIEEVWRTFGLPFAEKRRGDMSGSVVFEADRPSLSALKAKGSLHVERGQFYSPVSFKVFLVLGLPTLQESWIHGADLTFSIEQGLCYLEEIRVSGGDYELAGRGIVSFDGAADLELDYGGTTLAVGGKLEDPSVKVLPLSGITVPFDRLFRDRVRAKKGGE